MRLFAFWPILILMTVPQAIALYWEPKSPAYEDRAACEERLPDLEKAAMEDDGFREMARQINGGELPELSFSRECIEEPPQQYHRGLMQKSGPGSRT